MRVRMIQPWLAVSLALALLGAGSPAAARRDTEADLTNGDWTVKRSKESDKVQLQLRREWSKGGDHSSYSYSSDIARSELGISREEWQAGRAEVSFDLARDAGTLHFEGTLRHGEGEGGYGFEPNPRFRDELARAGFREISDYDMMRLALQDIDRDWVRGFAGRNLSLDDLVRFKVHGVTPEFVKAMKAGGYRDLSGDDLVRFKVHGVEPEFVQELGDLGYDRPSPDDLVRLKVHGVEPQYIRELLTIASPKPSMDDVIRLHVHGVEATYARDFRSAGFDDLAADDLVRLKVHGVTPALAKRAKSRYRDVTVDDLIRLKLHGEL